MLEVYSTNVTVGDESSISLDNVTLIKGNSATKNGNTITLNRCGVYEITIDGSVTIPTGTTVTVGMKKDGVYQEQAQATMTAVADQVIPFSFTTLVQVAFSNTPSPCTAPTNIDFVSSVEATYPHVNVTVTKLI